MYLVSHELHCRYLLNLRNLISVIKLNHFSDIAQTITGQMTGNKKFVIKYNKFTQLCHAKLVFK